MTDDRRPLGHFAWEASLSGRRSAVIGRSVLDLNVVHEELLSSIRRLANPFSLRIDHARRRGAWQIHRMTAVDGDDPHAASRVFGRRVREVRQARGMSQDALADAADVHPTAIGRYERGGREPRLTTILRLARALDVQPGELLNDLS